MLTKADQKYSKNSNIVCETLILFKIVAILIYHHHQQPLLQALVSQDSSEIIIIFWFDAQETFLIINVENSFAA